ncbi:uncharacterized protein BP5553_08209 [Venustampulla echinocandica]|uniref:Uncharacterized protein n=1 Tax=Venustampulla echinocandica TaxID=2656787 RepID=A0A370TG32_9HELO|nr:uncharacterized protein BP5553_08209 [Venustampulla echinocandica]RDL33841.1 hypothetical protein BP5553_08209 [Venustampulla echinocandica]
MKSVMVQGAPDTVRVLPQLGRTNGLFEPTTVRSFNFESAGVQTKISRTLIERLDGRSVLHKMAIKLLRGSSGLAEILLPISDPNPDAPRVFVVDTEFYQPEMGLTQEKTSAAKHIHQVRTATETVQQLKYWHLWPDDKVVESSLYPQNLFDVRSLHRLLEQSG